MAVPAPSIVALGDGRTVAYDDVGDPQGGVLVYLHGAPGCRLARHPDDGIAAAHGVRLLAVDRPGYGRSDAAPDPTFRGAASDVASLLDRLGVETCGLLGWSAGGPRALAAATVLGDRCRGVTVYAATGPLEAALDPAARAAAPGRDLILGAVLDDGAAVGEVAEEVAAFLLPVVPVPASLAVAAVRDSLSASARAEVEGVPGLLEALALAHVEASAWHGRAGLRGDLVAELTLGDAEALDPSCPVRLVYGDDDAVAAPAVGRWYAEHLRDATLEVWATATHHSLFPRWPDLLR